MCVLFEKEEEKKTIYHGAANKKEKPRAQAPGCQRTMWFWDIETGREELQSEIGMYA